jgi:hypothetical protein
MLSGVATKGVPMYPAAGLGEGLAYYGGLLVERDWFIWFLTILVLLIICGAGWWDYLRRHRDLEPPPRLPAWKVDRRW